LFSEHGINLVAVRFLKANQTEGRSRTLEGVGPQLSLGTGAEETFLPIALHNFTPADGGLSVTAAAQGRDSQERRTEHVEVICLAVRLHVEEPFAVNQRKLSSLSYDSFREQAISHPIRAEGVRLGSLTSWRFHATDDANAESPTRKGG
jgi:hypothetical protein